MNPFKKAESEPYVNEGSDDIPVMTEKVTGPFEIELPAPMSFEEFFWRAEMFRQELLSHSYGMNRKISVDEHDGRTVRYVFGAYGSGEPGSQAGPTTMEVSELSGEMEWVSVLATFQGAISFFVAREINEQIRKDLFKSLSTEQKEALKWITSDELAKLV